MTNTKNYIIEEALADKTAPMISAGKGAIGHENILNVQLSAAAETEKEWSEAGIGNAFLFEGGISEDLKGFLHLVAGDQNVTSGSFADRVQDKVLIARQNSKWRREFMEWKMTLLNEREKGRAEGRAEGKAEGLAKGLAEGSLLEQVELIIKKVKKGHALPDIADAIEKDTEEIRPIWEAVKAAAPEYDREKILRTLRDSESES